MSDQEVSDYQWTQDLRQIATDAVKRQKKPGRDYVDMELDKLEAGLRDPNSKLAQKIRKRAQRGYVSYTVRVVSVWCCSNTWVNWIDFEQYIEDRMSKMELPKGLTLQYIRDGYWISW